MISNEDLYSNKIFLNSVLPLLKVIIESKEEFSKKFEGKNAIVQVSALNEENKVGTHFIIENGKWQVVKGTVEKADLELEFKSIPALNAFFAGKSKKLPKIKGWYKFGLFISTMKVLTTMAKLLGADKPPEKEEDKELLVKLYFYLLSSGISQLNKAGHPEVSKWVGKSPDRVYAWRVEGKPELSAYIRLKAGKSKAARGTYKRSKPFFTMCFDSPDSALGILLEIDNLIESTVKGKLVMEGAPEYGAQIGEYMTLVGSYAK